MWVCNHREYLSATRIVHARTCVRIVDFVDIDIRTHLAHTRQLIYACIDLFTFSMSPLRHCCYEWWHDADWRFQLLMVWRLWRRKSCIEEIVWNMCIEKRYIWCARKSEVCLNLLSAKMSTVRWWSHHNFEPFRWVQGIYLPLTSNKIDPCGRQRENCSPIYFGDCFRLRCGTYHLGLQNVHHSIEIRN